MNLPLALHPENPHYFLFRGKPTVLVTSGEHYGAVVNLDFDYIRYLNELDACGLNHTRIWAGTYREITDSFNIEENVLAPNRFICPWARGNVRGNADGGMKFDLAQWDTAYFARLKDFMRETSRRGIVVEMNLFCPNYNEGFWKTSPMNPANNVQGIGPDDNNDLHALKHPEITAVQEAVTRKIVRELADFDNLYYEVCNEPYFGGVTREWQHHIADIIVETEKDWPHRHLISMNIANGGLKVEQPHPAVSIFNFHYCTPPDAVALNCHLNKVIGENETGFRGGEDAVYRSEGWDFLLAGGAIYNNLDFSFTVNHPDGTAKISAPGGGGPVLRRQLKVLKEFMDGLDFVRMTPDNGVIKGGVPQDATIHVLVEPGKQYAAYLKHASLGIPPNWPDWQKREPIAIHQTTRAELQLELPVGNYRVTWTHPASGKIEPSQRLQYPGGIATLVSPDYLEDIALVVKIEE
jgi:hypothetical protein